jgi:hypothetical protein
VLGCFVVNTGYSYRALQFRLGKDMCVWRNCCYTLSLLPFLLFLIAVFILYFSTLFYISLKNNSSDLWALFEFLMPGYLGPYSEFKSQFHVHHSNKVLDPDEAISIFSSFSLSPLFYIYIVVEHVFLLTLK